MTRRSRQKPKRSRASKAKVSSATSQAASVDVSDSEHQRDGETVTELTELPRWYFVAIGVVAFLALAIRVLHVLQTASLPTIHQPVGDSRGYLDWAARLAEGDWYGRETFYQAPLYPYFLGVLITLGGPSILWIRMVQAVLGAANSFFLGEATRRFFNPQAGVAAAVMMAFYGPAIYYDGIIQKASLAMFLLSSLVFLLSKVSEHQASLTFRSLLLCCGIGIVLGLLCLTRENVLVWIPFVLVWICSVAWLENWISRSKAGGAFVLGLILVLFPVAARNASLGGEWSPTTFQSGPNFYIGNGTHATGVYEPLVIGHQSPEFERTDAKMLAESFEGRPLSAREVSKFWFTRALMEMSEQPGRWCLLTGRKMLMTVNHYEVPDVESAYVHSVWSTPLRLTLTPWGFGLLFPIAFVGVYMALPRFTRCWILIAMTLTMIFAVAAFFILGRYRLPVAILLIPFAAFAVTSFSERLATNKMRITALGIFLCGLTLAVIPVHNVRGLTASAYMNVGVAFGKAGDAQQSAVWIGRSIELRGESAVGLYNLAGAQLLAGDRDAALDSLLKARQLNSNFLEVELQLAQLYEEKGAFADAAAHYRAVLQIDPSNQKAALKIRALNGSNATILKESGKE